MSELDGLFKAIRETRKLPDEEANGVSGKRKEEILEEKNNIMRKIGCNI